MEKISLYIAGKKVDLDNNSFILFNYTMEDLSNPTIVKNSFSKQITLKGTPANNEVFGNLYRADRRTIFGDGYTGVAFDPLRKTPFTIYNEMNEIIESGYVKVDSVDKVSGGYEYKVTLYGGLGSFFYGLTYDSDGNKRDLSTFKFKHHDGSVKVIQSKKVTTSVLQDAWSYLENGSSYWESNPSAMWDILNFAPCYNGLPEDFDADKVLVKGLYAQFAVATTIDGANYTEKTGCTTSLVKLAKAHTEWEVKNIRPYLQRPVLSVEAFIQGVCLSANNNGYKVELDEEFFSSTNPIYQRGWITMPMIPVANRNSSDALQAVLRGSLSPCEYLVGFAKMYGLLFQCDTNNTIRIVSRNKFYRNNVIDITNRIDVSSVSVTPLVVDSKWYQLGGAKVVGEFAKQYEQNHAKKYAVQKINTGYEFNSEIKELTKDIPFIEAADVAERSYLYAGYYSPFTFIWLEIFPFPLYEEVNRQLFKEGNENDPMDVKFDNIYYRGAVFDESHPYVDWLPKVQFHDENNKAVDGANCLLFFNGIKSVPYLAGPGQNWRYILSDDHPDIQELNSGKACWNLASDTAKELLSFPSFRRMYLASTGDTNQVIDDLGWGVPSERGVVDITQDSTNPSTLYHNRWKAYLTDRYDANTRKMKCKVNLSGLKVGQDLMRDFYWYDNTIWMLNKIENYSMTTDDLTECEFVKVKDIKNYTEGQKL